MFLRAGPATVHLLTAARSARLTFGVGAWTVEVPATVTAEEASSPVRLPSRESAVMMHHAHWNTLATR